VVLVVPTGGHRKPADVIWHNVVGKDRFCQVCGACWVSAPCERVRRIPLMACYLF